MALLAINTCENTCAVLVRTQAGDTLRTIEMRTGHDRALAELTGQTLKAASVSAQNIERIAVSIGPGSFTGVRIGVAFARALALSCSAEIVGVHLLEVLATQALTSGVELGIGLRDIGRGQLGWCALGPQGLEQLPTVCEPEQLPDALLALAAGRAWTVFGDTSCGIEPVEDCPQVSMSVLANVAQVAALATNPAVPWYGRAPDAKLPGGIDPWA
ncbi:MAG: tRNA (adenosine(37)-N6)-threonylcarbamoyltransferase complex dimerization subunit type 1 TsaB [Robiginitomaculum sp.]|nr:MAG: tRNA (adenosine(37)-N6)-threonylcarbamoyltransferase complex dimerization subunit type 1 TsaB [Robiginitomaculum sp.]